MSIRIPGPHSPVWVIAESVAAAAFSLVSMMAIGRVIGPHAAGVGTTAIAAFLLMDICSAALFPDSLVQRQDLKRRHSHSAGTAAILLAIAEGLLLVCIGPYLSSGPDSATVARMCFVLAPLLPLSAFAGTVSGLLVRQQRFRLLSQRLLVGQPLALAAGLAAAQYGFGPWAMIATQVVATCVTFLLMLFGSRVSYAPAFDIRALRDLWPIAGPQIASILITFGRNRIFVLVLAHMLVPAVLGVANLAFRLSDAATGIILQAISRIALPRLCALQHDREAMAEAYGDLMQLQGLFGFPICAGLALTAPDLVHALLGPAWADAGSATRIVATAALFACVAGDYGSLFLAVGKARRNFQVSAAELVLPLATLLLLHPKTAEGAALAWCAQLLVLPPVLIGIVLHELGRPLGWLLRRQLPSIVATAAMAAVVLLVQDAVGHNPLPRLVAAIAVGVPVYTAVAAMALGGLPRALVRAAPGT